MKGCMVWSVDTYMKKYVCAPRYEARLGQYSSTYCEMMDLRDRCGAYSLSCLVCGGRGKIVNFFTLFEERLGLG